MYEVPSIISFSVKQLSAIIATSACSAFASCGEGTAFNQETCDPNANNEGGSFGGGAHN